MDKLQWFKFSPLDWAMGKIQRVPEITQARYVRLICLYWTKECFLSYEDAEIEIDKEHLDILISKKIIKLNNGNIDIDFMLEQMENVIDIGSKRRNSALKRWKKTDEQDTNDMQVHANALQDNADKIRVDKSREDKKRKENIIIPDFSEFLLYAKEKEPSVNEGDLKLKYLSWVENGWKDGNNSPIVKWKVKLLNTMPYIKKDLITNGNKPKMVY